MTIIVTIVIFAIIIFIHELGHFIAAKKSGITVHEFALGMGPKLYSFNKNETCYSIRLFPIGGYVQMEGENEESNDPNAFSKKPLSSRIMVVIAGALMNLVLGFLILIIMASFKDTYASSTIGRFNENAKSATTGLMVGDTIKKINGITIYTDKDLIGELLNDEDGVYNMVVIRSGEKVKLDGVTFDYEGEGDNRKLNIDFKVDPIKRNFLTVFQNAGNNFVSLMRSIWLSLGQLLSGKVGFTELSGPVGVSQVVSQAMSIGLDPILYLAALLTINVGIFNLLPLPALDGGRLVFLLFELIRGKPLNPKYEGVIHATGLVLLLGLMVVITFKDVIGLF